jgi:MSHA biogenesis protein MshI
VLSILRRPLQPGWIGCAPQGAESSFALVQRRPGDKPAVRWLASVDWSRPGEALRGLRRSHALHRHRRVAVLPAQQYKCIGLDAPADMPREDWRAAVRWQLKDSVDFALDDAAIDLLAVPEGTSYRAQPQLIVVAAAAGEVRPLMAQGHDAGLPWQAVDIGETALRNLSVLCEPDGRAQALLHCQPRHATLVFTTRGELLSTRRLELVLDELNHDDDSVRLPAFDRAVLELQRTLDGFERAFGQVSLARLLVATMPGQQRFLDHLAPLLYVPVEPLDLASLVDIDAVAAVAADPEQLNRHLCAIGAALRDDPN